MEANAGIDAIQVTLTGGATNTSPAASLGGVISSTVVHGIGCLVQQAVSGLHILDVNGTCGEGSATIECSESDGTATFTAPDDTAGAAVSIDETETRILPSNDTTKTIKVYREANLPFQGTATLSLVGIVGGSISLDFVEDAERQAGSIKYRAIAITNNSAQPILDLQVQIANPSELQAEYSFGSEVPISGEVQLIADEDTSPEGISFSALLRVPLLLPAETIVVWIQREFPASGTVSAKESPDLSITYQGE